MKAVLVSALLATAAAFAPAAQVCCFNPLEMNEREEAFIISNEIDEDRCA
jgi:hypothetical protein